MALEEQGFVEELTKKTFKLTDAAKKILQEIKFNHVTNVWLGFDSAIFAYIEKSESLVEHINKFVSTPANRYNPDTNKVEPMAAKIEFSSKISYEGKSNTIFINVNSLYATDFYDVISDLAHEVTHAVGDFTYAPFKVDSAQELSDQVNLREGEAVYYQLIALMDIFPGREDFKPLSWRNNETAITNIDIFNDLKSIINYDPNKKDNLLEMKAKWKELGEWNKEFSLTIAKIAIPLTYDEYHKWIWLKQASYFSIDYWESQGVFGYLRTNEGRIAAMKAIEVSPEHMFNIKVLVNQANNYLGIDDASKNFEDTLNVRDGFIDKDGKVIAEKGSPLGNITTIRGSDREATEVLWGGRGSDTLNGNNTNDILLGGDGDDHLYGNGGNDRLAGNIGNDTLDGGSGVNHLYGGEGNDTYIVGEGYDIIEDSDNNGTILLKNKNGDNIPLIGGSNLNYQKNNNLNAYDDTANGITYYFVPTGRLSSPVGRLAITKDGKLIAVINNFNRNSGNTRAGNKGYLGIVLTDENIEIPETADLPVFEQNFLFNSLVTLNIK